MNANDSQSDHSGILYTASSIFTLYSLKVSILVPNIYVNNLEERLLRGSLLPCYIKLKNCKFSKKLETASIEFDFYKFQC